jgi:RNA polymerase sigma-70 factor (ECF subfamily)
MAAPVISLALALARAFRDEGGRELTDPEDLEPLLLDVLRRARARWPGLQVDDADFIVYLARRLPDDAPARASLEATHSDDLYLAFACGRGDNAALRAFDRAFLGEVGAFVAGVDRSPVFVDEVRQTLRDKLFAGNPGEAKITEYTGRGALGGWVRVAALRIALNMKRGDQRAAAAGKASIERELGAGLSPELAYLQEHYREAFAEALRATLADLSDRERTLLRLYHVDGLSLEAMAALYRVHLSTVSRWLTCARAQVADGTARHLRERLGVGRSDVDSIAALVMSQIDVSLTRLLGGGR